MKLKKIAGIGILLLLLILAAWYGMQNIDITQSAKEASVQESDAESFESSDSSASAEKAESTKSHESIEGAENTEFSENTESEEVSAGARSKPATENTASAGKLLDLAEIQKMDAGSVLDISKIQEDILPSLFYSETPGVDIQQRILGVSFQENDNISMEELRYLRVLHLGFDGQTHIGELLVNQSIAEDVLEIMEELYENCYAIEKMVLVDDYDADDELSMEDNNTSSFNYREIAGSSKLSRHSLGLALDINPLYNPCVRNGGTSVSPANAADYADRNREFEHKIDENDLCYRLFTEHGFAWGGNWNSLKDYQHFQK